MFKPDIFEVISLHCCSVGQVLICLLFAKKNHKHLSLLSSDSSSSTCSNLNICKLYIPTTLNIIDCKSSYVCRVINSLRYLSILQTFAKQKTIQKYACVAVNQFALHPYPILSSIKMSVVGVLAHGLASNIGRSGATTEELFVGAAAHKTHAALYRRRVT